MRKSYKKISVPSEKKQYRRKLSIRKKVSGTSERPRLCIVKTNKHLSAQLIDDNMGFTIISASTFGKKKVGDGCNVNSAVALAKSLSDGLKSKGIGTIVFDRNGKTYSGIIKKFADAVRENGIVF